MKGVSEIRAIGRLLIIGMGRSGRAAALAACRVLPAVEVILSDRQPGVLNVDDETLLIDAGVKIEPGRSDNALLEGCGLIIKSPGVPVDILLLGEARSRGIPIWGEAEFAWRFLPNPFVGITGTNGKTTTTELIGHILREAGRPCRVAGNVGTALSSLVGEVNDDEILVVELSSFQLEDSVRLRPDIAVLLNLSEDHLDRHPDFGGYLSAKMRIFANQKPGDVAVINFDDPNCRRPIPGDAARVWFSRSGQGEEPLVFGRDGVIYASLNGLDRVAADFRCQLPGSCGAGPGASRAGAPGYGRNEPGGGEISSKAANSFPVPVMDWSQAALKGDHNLENSLAATAVALILGLTAGEVAAGLRSFPGVRHRLQEVRVVDGIKYVDDSKATNENSAIAALTAFENGVHLILGGSLKGCSFDRLAAAASPQKVSEVILIGESAPVIARSFAGSGVPVREAGRLEEAVRVASGNAVPGDVVLLAPACASFDQYKNYEERGEHFISLVNSL